MVVGTDPIIPPIAPPHFSMDMATPMAIRNHTAAETIVFIQYIYCRKELLSEK